MGVESKTVQAVCEQHDFIHLPWRIYADDPNWVPPLLAKMRRIIDHRTNGYPCRGPHRLFVAYRDGRPAGRIMAGVDERYGLGKSRRRGGKGL